MKKIILIFSFIVIICAAATAQQFKVSYNAAAMDKPFTGKVFLYLSKNNTSPKDETVGMDAFECFSVDVKNVQPGAAVLIDDNANSYPVKLTDIERGEYFVQAVWDRNLGGRAINESPGNIYSKPVKVLLDKDFTRSFSLVCDLVIPEKTFTDTKYAKELKAPSALLSAFLKKPMTVDAAVVLPAGYYDNPDKKYPVLFHVFGWGADYHRFSGDTSSRSHELDTLPCISVYLDGNCSLGHCVYANSDNNGPWGDALTKEFIPLLESKYRCNGARLLFGHSSGGWTVIYLQTHFPKVFTACWSSSPDPVDFHSFQKVNLYTGENMFYGKDSNLNAVATIAGFFPVASQKQAWQQEAVLYRGEQMHSFDAVFSARDANGNPMRICNPLTGEINQTTFAHWKNYDISAYLVANWNDLKADLAGKLRLTVGNNDNFLLNYAVHMPEANTKGLNTGFEIAYYPGDHFTVATDEYRKAGIAFLIGKYEEWEKER
jgi:hypothetical protein